MATRLDMPSTQMLIGVFLLHYIVPIAYGQTEAKAEADVAAKIILSRGSVTKDRDGRIIGVHLIGNTDEQIESIDFSVLLRLESLTILCPKMTKRSLVHLRKVPCGLLTLRITGAQIDDKELGPLLQKQKSLIWICLRDTAITDLTLSEIGKLDHVSCLCLDGTVVTDKGLGQLTHLQDLSFLQLSHTKISDAGLRQIKEMQSLCAVYLRGTNVTDLGIQELGGLEYLRRLDVVGTQVSQAGKDTLIKLLPQLEFED